MQVKPGYPTRTPLVRVVDLNVGESQEVELYNGKTATVKLLDVEESRDEVLSAVFDAKVKVEVNSLPVTLKAALYHLPTSVSDVQIDCTVTRGSVQHSHMDHWGLDKDARLRLWPAGSPLVAPGTFVYPAKQRWFACGVSMANEPVSPRSGGKLYYHAGLDIGGAEGMVEVLSATDGLVVAAGGREMDLGPLPHPPIEAHYANVWVLDDRGWYCLYTHLASIDLGVKVGQTVEAGQRIGVLGKETDSGGWAHLHFEVKSLQPSGKWGTEEAYAFIHEAYQRQYASGTVAVAQPQYLAWTGQEVMLDGTRSWSETGVIARYDWTFTDRKRAAGPRVARIYNHPGTYSEILKVTDSNGRIDYDFARVTILDRACPDRWPIRLHAAYAPSLDIQPNDLVTFKVRAFNVTEGHETWDFGDGSPPVSVKSAPYAPSEGYADKHARDGYAATVHRYSQPGDYLARVERSDEHGAKAVSHVRIGVGGGA